MLIHFSSFILDLALKKRHPMFYPCTPLGCLKLIKSVCPEITGKDVVICGRSNIVGLPLSLLMNKHNATVTLCHERSKNVKEVSTKADIFITAIGKANFYDKEWLKEDAIVIDVGINEITQLND